MTSSGRWIAHRAHRSSIEKVQLISTAPSTETRRGEGWLAIRTGVLSNDFNCVVSRIDASLPAALVEELVAWTTADDRPASWLTTAASPPLTEALLGAGAHPERTGNWCGADLADLDLRGAESDTVEITSVQGDADLADWLDLADACGWLRAGDRAARAQLYRQIGLSDGPLHHWVARIDGCPVGFASSMMSGDVLDLCDLGVIEPMRRRGVGRALAMHRIRVAACGGVRYAVAAPSQDGWELHRTLGFALTAVVPDVCFYLEPGAR